MSNSDVLDPFPADVRRIANLITYGRPTTQIPRILVTMATLYLEWLSADYPTVPSRKGSTTSGEFIAR